MFRTIITTRRETSGKGSNKFSPYVGRMATRAHNFNKSKSLGATACGVCADCSSGNVTRNTSGSGCSFICNSSTGSIPCNY